MQGAYRFLRRVWALATDFKMRRSTGALNLTTPSPALRFEVHSLLRQANYDLDKQQFNTVASAGMKLLNALEKAAGSDDDLVNEGLSILLRLLAPITPHLCETLWRDLGFGASLLDAPWPEPDAGALVRDEIELVLQVNGKLRGAMTVSTDLPKEHIEALALAHPSLEKHLAGQTIRKVVVVPGRLVNVVV